jgi:hypothetical protein
VSAVRTALAGMIGLALLDASVSSQAAAGRVGGLLTAVATVIEHVLSPTVPAIPDLRTRGKAGAIGTADTTGGSLLPADWTTSPTVPAAPTAPSQLYA